MRVTALLFSLALILFSFGSVMGQGIYVDNVVGLNGDGTIPAGANLTFNMRITGDGTAHLMLNNGFVIKSADVAWTSVAANYVDPDLDGWFDFIKVLNLWANGSVEDTVGLGLLSLFGTGLPAGYDKVAFEIIIGPVTGPPGSILTLDSSWYPPSNPWMWDLVGEDVEWIGPYEYAMETPCVSVAITSSPVVDGEIGVLYSYDVEATGTPDPTFDLTTSPGGMTIDPASGLIEWTPDAAGAYDVTVIATNGCGPDVSQSYVITVPEPLVAPSITSMPGTDAQVGVAYAYDVDATGNPAPGFSLSVFPAGMTINGTTGLIGWTPAASGEFDVTVVAANGVLPDAEQSFTITVVEPPVITTTAPTGGQVGVAYSYDVDATGYPVPTFELTTAPGTMTIDAITGVIGWTPAAAGDFDVTVRAVNGVNPPASESFTITVIEAYSAPFITSSPGLDGVVGGGYSYDVEATGYPVPTFALTVNPGGMTINTNTGVINWTPAAAGDFDVTVVAANGILPDAEQSFTITVVDAPEAPVITTIAPTDGQVGVAYSYDVDATGNPVPTYELTAAPGTMTIDAVTGVIGWTPAAAGNFDVTVRAVNGVNPPASQSFTIAVIEAFTAPEIVSTPPVGDAQVGQEYVYNVAATGYPAPTYSLDLAPAGMDIDVNQGIITWTPSSSQTGNNDVTVVASNGIEPDASQSFTVFVPDAPYTDCYPQPTILKDLGNDRILDVRIYNEDPANVDHGSIRVQSKIPPYTGVRVEAGVIITDAFIMRFLGSSGFRPVTDDFTATYTVDYSYIDGTPATTLVGDFALKVNPGDVTFDAVVDMDDVILMADFFFNSGKVASYSNYQMPEFMDVNGDGDVNPQDLLEVIKLANL